VIAVSTLKAFWKNRPQYRDAEGPTLAWYRDVLKADWSKPSEVKRQYGNASILKDGRVVFNIAGNRYRIVVWINCPYRVMYVRFISTHEQYDRMDAQRV
jgi:mRNA interferase HigB